VWATMKAGALLDRVEALHSQVADGDGQLVEVDVVAPPAEISRGWTWTWFPHPAELCDEG
jgi:hypothetical protein